MPSKPSHLRLVRLEEKIDQVLDAQSTMSATLAAQHVSLGEHIRRSTLLEEEFKPIKTHVAMWGGAGKLLVTLGTLAGIAGALVKLFG